MSNTGAINGSSPINTAGADFGMHGGFVSPDMILQYVANRLYGVDTQMQGLMQKQGDMEKHGKLLSDLADELGRWQQQGVGGKDGKPIAEMRGDAEGMLKAYDRAIAAAGGAGTALGSELQKAKDNIRSSIEKGGPVNGDADGYASNTEMVNALQEITRLQNDVSRGGEMLMMNLQSLSSKRQAILSMGTNTLSGLGETYKSIAMNIGK